MVQDLHSMLAWRHVSSKQGRGAKQWEKYVHHFGSNATKWERMGFALQYLVSCHTIIKGKGGFVNEGAITWKRIELVYCKIWLPYVRHVSMWYDLGLAVHLGNANYGIQNFVLEKYGPFGNPCIRWTPTKAIWVGEVKHRGSLGNFSKANHITWVN